MALADELRLFFGPRNSRPNHRALITEKNLQSHIIPTIHALYGWLLTLSGYIMLIFVCGHLFLWQIGTTTHCACVWAFPHRSWSQLASSLYENSPFRNNGNYHLENVLSVCSRWNETATPGVTLSPGSKFYNVNENWNQDCVERWDQLGQVGWTHPRDWNLPCTQAFKVKKHTRYLRLEWPSTRDHVKRKDQGESKQIW